MHVPRGLGDRKGRTRLSVNASVRWTSKGNRQGHQRTKNDNERKANNDGMTTKVTPTNGERDRES